MRISNKVWDAAQEAAGKQGDKVVNVVIAALIAYAANPTKTLAALAAIRAEEA